VNETMPCEAMSAWRDPQAFADVCRRRANDIKNTLLCSIADQRDGLEFGNSKINSLWDVFVLVLGTKKLLVLPIQCRARTLLYSDAQGSRRLHQS
jgi:hypothetical protein